MHKIKLLLYYGKLYLIPTHIGLLNDDNLSVENYKCHC